MESLNDIISSVFSEFTSGVRDNGSIELSPCGVSIVIFAGTSLALAQLKKIKKEEHVNGIDE